MIKMRIKRLNEYIRTDKVYQDYKRGVEPSHNDVCADFEWFCIEHCQDIEYVLNKNKELTKKYNEFKKGLRKVMFRSQKWKNRYYKERYIRKNLEKWLDSMLDNENDIFSVVRVNDVVDKIKELKER